jgi:hypothetical protein
MSRRLPRLTVKGWSIAVLSALASAGALVLAAGGLAAFDPTVQIVGCSNSRLIATAYTFASVRDAAVNSASGGASLSVWAKEGSPAWAGTSGRTLGFDAAFEASGATMVWYPLCIKGGEFSTKGNAYRSFLQFVSLLRKRTDAPLYLSATIGEQPECGNAKGQQAYVVDRAVAEGVALRGPEIPPASVPQPDMCHFDVEQSTNVQESAVAFLDG